MRKKRLLILSTGLITCGTLMAVCFSTSASSLSVSGSDTWLHYEAVAATCESYGIKEYWTNCKGNTTIVEPVGGVDTEKGQPSAADIKYNVDTYVTDD